MKTDMELKNDVLAELLWEPGVDAAEIGVAVEHGVVTLSGNVNTYYKKWIAERAAKRVSGVKALAEEIKVKLPGSSQRTDTDIAEAAVNAMELNDSIPDDLIEVKVENGRITLGGEVSWQYQKRAAEGAVGHLVGVKGVNNYLTVKPKEKPVEVKAKIIEAFERHARLDAQKIQVVTIGGKVILHGSVPSWAEREEAEDAAWASPGVSDVENHIMVVH